MVFKSPLAVVTTLSMYDDNPADWRCDSDETTKGSAVALLLVLYLKSLTTNYNSRQERRHVHLATAFKANMA